MSANDVKAIISEIVQGIVAIGSLAALVLLPSPSPIIFMVLGGALLSFGIKIGIPLSPAEGAAVQVSTPSASVSASTGGPQE